MILYLGLIFATSAVAAILSLILLLRPRELPGCAPQSACGVITSSRWSRIGAVNVALPGSLVYVIAGGAGLMQWGQFAESAAAQILNLCAPVALGSAVWFTVLQIAIFKRVCVFCSLVHGAGIILAVCILLAIPPAVLPLTAGSAIIVLFVILQILFRPKQYEFVQVSRVDQLSSPTPHAAQFLNLVAGRIEIDCSDWPFFGSAEARHHVAFVFDVTCHDCRELYKQLLTFARQNSELGIYAIPVPTNPSLNPRIRSTDNFHPESADHARIMLALWHLDPAVYRQYESWFLAQASLRSLFEIRSLAGRILGTARFTLALSNSVVESRLRKAVEIYLKLESDSLPQILLPHGAVLGSITGSDLLEILKKKSVNRNAPADVA